MKSHSYMEDAEHKLYHHHEEKAELYAYDLAHSFNRTMRIASHILDDNGNRAFFKLGPPTIAWGVLPHDETISVPVLIKNFQRTNDPLNNPQNWVIQVDNIITREHPDDKTPTVAGQLIPVAQLQMQEKEVPPTHHNTVEKSAPSSTNVMEISSPNGIVRIRLGDSGSIEFIGPDNKIMYSMSPATIIKNVPEQDREMPGTDKNTWVKERHWIHQILPRAFVPPFNLPAQIPDLSMFARASELATDVGDLLRANSALKRRSDVRRK